MNRLLKKFFVLLSLVAIFVSCSNSGKVGKGGEKPTEPQGQIIIGSTTNIEGEFYDTLFNNSGFNYNAYDLIHSGGTISYTKENEFIVNPTVSKSIDSTDNEDGSKTYTITINDGLVWSDDTPITAKDYVFAMLLESSPEMKGVDAYPANGYQVVVGWDEFSEGKTKNFKGVRLISDKTFSLTIKAEELPYHYDIAYAGVGPRPMAVIAPECDIVDSENGASISGDFTTELLTKTINDPVTGYRYNPKVTCGPYLFKGYDQASEQATFEVNPKYAGDYRGVKPMIKTVILKTVKNATQFNELEAGTVDMLYSISGKTSIESGLDLVDANKVQKATYFRNGYGKIAFDCSEFPTDSYKIRQAIALCLDRNEFARQYSGGYATIVHAAYGMAQAEYTEAKDWIEENLDTYEKDLERAKSLVIGEGFVYNKDGSDYTSGIRYKKVGGELKPLQIKWCNTEGNPVSELLATMLPEAMKEVGMELLPTTTDFPTLLLSLDHETENTFNMFNMATGFSATNSPWYYYSAKYVGNYNSNWIEDKELEDAVKPLKNIPYEDKELWLSSWKTYIKEWNKKLPDVPLYSDEYHDFYIMKVQGWDPSSTWVWSSALLDAWVTE